MMKTIYIAIILLFAQTGFGQITMKNTGGGSGGGTVIIGGSESSRVTFNTQTGNYTLVLTDSAKQITMNAASANVLTVPLNSSVAFPVGTVITVFQYGAGQSTIAATGGVTIRSAGARYNLYEQYSSAILTKIATDEWQLVGDLNF